MIVERPVIRVSDLKKYNIDMKITRSRGGRMERGRKAEEKSITFMEENFEAVKGCVSQEKLEKEKEKKQE